MSSEDDNPFATQQEVHEAAEVGQVMVWKWAKLGILPKPTLVSRGDRKGTYNRWPREAVERARWARGRLNAGHTLSEVAEMAQERWPG